MKNLWNSDLQKEYDNMMARYYGKNSHYNPNFYGMKDDKCYQELEEIVENKTNEIMKETQYKEVKDSGERQVFHSGSVRDTSEGKGRYDLIPAYPMLRLARHYENGSKKYGDRNWEKGQPLSRYLCSAERHLNAIKMGLNDEDHLSAVLWNIMAVIETEKKVELGLLPKELNDLPKPYGENDLR